MLSCAADPVATATPAMRAWLVQRFGEWWNSASFPDAEVHRSIDYRYPDDTTRLAAGNWVAPAAGGISEFLSDQLAPA